jgi:hypothetical protein
MVYPSSSLFGMVSTAGLSWRSGEWCLHHASHQRYCAAHRAIPRSRQLSSVGDEGTWPAGFLPPCPKNDILNRENAGKLWDSVVPNFETPCGHPWAVTFCESSLPWSTLLEATKFEEPCVASWRQKMAVHLFGTPGFSAINCERDYDEKSVSFNII